MKKILITGANSYIGTSFEKYMKNWSDDYQIDTLDMTSDNWKEFNFSNYEIVFHVAGIAHRKPHENGESIYFAVNRDLAFETCKISKGKGVKHFIFVSSMSVFGVVSGNINDETVPNPKNPYGKSKLEAEVLILNCQDKQFNVSCIRPPMVYGYDCKGNYIKLSKIAKKCIVFPDFNNNRSMIYIDNLSEYVRQVIENRQYGILHPQNSDYVNTSDMVSLIAKVNKKKIIKIKLPKIIIRVLNISLLQKVFGTLVYDKSLSTFDFSYNCVSFEESIIRSEGR